MIVRFILPPDSILALMTPQDLAELVDAKGNVNPHEIAINSLNPGTIVRAVTASGNCYFYEIATDGHAHVFSCRTTELGDSGFRGLRRISPILCVGYIIEHRGSFGAASRSHTSTVKELTVFPRKNPLTLAVRFSDILAMS